MKSFDKRNMFRTIYENGDLLLNPLFNQCPICGSVVSLGYFNDVIGKENTLWHQINGATRELCPRAKIGMSVSDVRFQTAT